MLKDGVYEVPFQLLRLKEDRVSMGDKGFLHPAVLELKDGVATVQLQLTELSCRSVVGRMLTGKLTQLRYYTERLSRSSNHRRPLQYHIRTDGTATGYPWQSAGRLLTGKGAHLGRRWRNARINARLIFNFRAMKKKTVEDSAKLT